MSINGPVNGGSVPLPLSLRTGEATARSTERAATPTVSHGATSATSTVKTAVSAPVDMFGALRASLNRAASVADMSLSVGDSLGSALNQMQGIAQQASDPKLTAQIRSGLQNSYSTLLNTLSSGVNAASFDNINLINGSQTDGVNFVANPQGDKFITLQPADLRPGSNVITLTSDSNVMSVDSAKSAQDQISQSLQNLGQAMQVLQTAARQIDVHSTFLNRLGTAGNAQLSTASTQDLSKESAKLQALQIQQQLSSANISIANQTPNSVLGLFRS